MYREIFNVTIDEQHGFVKGCLTVTNLGILTDFFHLRNVKISLQIDVMNINFSKAFDKVDHHILLNKLKSMGISEDLIIF